MGSYVVRRAQPRPPWFHLVRPGGPPLTLAEKLDACQDAFWVEELAEGARVAETMSGIVPPPEAKASYYSACQRLGMKPIWGQKRSSQR